MFNDWSAPTAVIDEEGWTRALVVVAHPDDIEFCGASGVVARWAAHGKSVTYCMVTSGEAGIDALEPSRARAVREREQIRACEAVGASQYRFMRFPDGRLVDSLEARAALIEVIRQERPETVMTLNFREQWTSMDEWNHPDHVVTGRVLLDAVSQAGNRWLFPEQLVGGVEPWTGTRRVVAAGSPRSTHVVDITDYFDRAVEALATHKVYNLGLRWRGFDPRTWLERIVGAEGSGRDGRMLVPFEVINFHL